MELLSPVINTFYSGGGLKKAKLIDLLTGYIVSSIIISKIKQYFLLPPVMPFQQLYSIFEIEFDFEQYSSMWIRMKPKFF
jgi:hypothetical protein